MGFWAVRMAIGIGLLLVLAMLLGAVYLIRPRRLRFTVGVPRVLELTLEVESDRPTIAEPHGAEYEGSEPLAP
jgi:hypothetical protein